MQLFINNTSYKIQKNEINNPDISLTILQQCNTIGIKIPRFCYHESLSIAGNCRMCLIEKEKTIKPLASCAINITDNLKVFTKSVFVKKIRENVLEFLLINHPLDCPICDQGGECDLQDQSVLYGNDRSRFNESKRSVIDKECGVFIKTVMTRCIHCTRCVRFLNEISGFSFFGVVGRGSKMEISNYILNSIKYFNEFSGNIIDICPVGALTSKPYAFNSRPWELFKFACINVIDPLASYFSLNYKNNKIYRILPYRENDFLITEWIPDNIRFFYDGIHIQRIKKPFYFFKFFSFFISLKKLLFIYKCFLSFNKKSKFNLLYNFIFDNTIDFFFLKKLKKILCRLPLYNLTLNRRLFNSNFNYNIHRTQFLSLDFKEILEKNSNNFYIILIGLNPRIEFYHLYLYLRKNFLKNTKILYEIFSFNSNVLLNFEFKTLTSNLKYFFNFFNLKKKYSYNLLFNNKILFFTSQNLFFKNYKIMSFINILREKIIKNNNILNYFIFNDVIFYSIFELGFFEKYNTLIFKKKKFISLNFFYNLNYKKKIKDINNTFNLFFSPIGSDFLNNKNTNFIIPTSLYLEKSVGFMNFYGVFKYMKSELNFYNLLSIKNLISYFFYQITNLNLFFLKKDIKNLYINIKELYLNLYKILNVIVKKTFNLQNSIITKNNFYNNTIIEKNSNNLKNNLNYFGTFFIQNFKINLKTLY